MHEAWKRSVAAGTAAAALIAGTTVVGLSSAGASAHRGKPPAACVAAIRDYQTVVTDLKAVATKAVTTLGSLIGTLTASAAQSKANAFEATLKAEEPAYKALMAKTTAAAKKCES